MLPGTRKPSIVGLRLQLFFDKWFALRKTRVWQEAEQERRAKGRHEGRHEMRVQLVQQWLAKGMAIQEIAALLDTTVQQVRRLRRNGRRGGCQ